LQAGLDEAIVEILDDLSGVGSDVSGLRRFHEQLRRETLRQGGIASTFSFSVLKVIAVPFGVSDDYIALWTGDAGIKV
jgi:hypothetical protein